MTTDKPVVLLSSSAAMDGGAVVRADVAPLCPLRALVRPPLDLCERSIKPNLKMPSHTRSVTRPGRVVYASKLHADS